MDIPGKHIVIFGATGMLGKDIAKSFRKANARITTVSRKSSGVDATVDLANRKEVNDLLAEARPDLVVNAAAYTAVDDAESDAVTAFKTNALGPLNIARAVRDHGRFMVHFSTDYVFGGSKVSKRNHPYAEEDACAPCGVYGESKRMGEQAIDAVLGNKSLIIRTSWLHGLTGKNFVNTILNAAKEKSELKIVSDQFGNPTYTPWLADMTTKMVTAGLRGIYHVAQRGGVSWFDLAKFVCQTAGYSTEILPQSTAELGRPAPRPAYSVLAVGKLENVLDLQVPGWQDGVVQHIKEKSSKK